MRCLWMIVRPSKPRSGCESSHPRLVVWWLWFYSFYRSYRVTKYAKLKATQASSRQVCKCVCALKTCGLDCFFHFHPWSVLQSSPVCFVLYVATYFGECRIHLVVYSTKCIFGFDQMTLLYRISIIILITSIEKKHSFCLEQEGTGSRQSFSKTVWRNDL